MVFEASKRYGLLQTAAASETYGLAGGNGGDHGADNLKAGVAFNTHEPFIYRREKVSEDSVAKVAEIVCQTLNSRPGIYSNSAAAQHG